MITIKNLRKEYPNDTPLKDINAEIKEGEIISIIGPSGTGKSTLLRCLNLLEKPTKGEIIIDGQCVTDKNCKVNLVRQKMGMVFQSFNLFAHLTIIENIMLGPVKLLNQSRQEAYDYGMQLLETVGLADKAKAYPDELSGGQKQRVAIARTLAMKPEIILFDEPTSALDPTMVAEVQSVIRGLARKGLTMLIVTHEMKFARDVSDRIFYMDEGLIYEEGTAQQIFEAPQKEKTQQFIRKLRVFEEDITSKRFDFIGLNCRIEEFGRKHLISQKTIYNLQVVFEEMCVQTILPKLPDSFEMKVMIEYSDETENADIRIRYDATAYNPLEEEDDISMKLISNAANKLKYFFHEEEKLCNDIHIEVKN